ncbi:MAG: hypothetical protein IPK65_00355 [Gammaproteobacteria bacterium]|nr:hypothetical protein [Gammaproteobacteria bacterium]
MSKLIYICARAGQGVPYGERDLAAVFERLTPDNLRPRPPRIIAGDGVLIGIFNPVESLPVEGRSVCLGALLDRRADWWRPGAEVPDGSYALFRGEGETLELVSDIVGSRMIWYVQTDEVFIASTSQRAIVCLLGSYEPNEAVYPWMLSSGTLGPGLSWDRRIRCLGPDARLRLDRRAWKVAVEQRPVVFAPEDLPRAEHERRLGEALEATFAGLDLDLKHWVLPLSGGYDSRAILLMLKEQTGLKAVTWGLKSALKDRQSDAWVARELARHFGLAHEYMEIDRSDESAERILARFLTTGEGRTDHIAGYMDGLAIWQRLHESGCRGILRGDEAFGCRVVHSDLDVYRNMSFTVLGDFPNLDAGVLGALSAPQARPEFLRRGSTETREAWRDRVNVLFEMPAVFTALSDLKLAYVEVIHPLLSRRIVEAVRKLPDELRTEKSLFKAVVNRVGPKLRYAKRPAIEAHGNIIGNPVITARIRESLGESARRADRIAALSRYALAFMDSGTQPTPRNDRALPARLLRSVRRRMGLSDTRPPAMDPCRFAFRSYIVSNMHDMLCEDANMLNGRRCATRVS